MEPEKGLEASESEKQKDAGLAPEEEGFQV